MKHMRNQDLLEAFRAWTANRATGAAAFEVFAAQVGVDDVVSLRGRVIQYHAATNMLYNAVGNEILERMGGLEVTRLDDDLNDVSDESTDGGAS